MNDDRFDGLTRLTSHLAEQLATRRSVLRALIAGSGGAALAATSAIATPGHSQAIQARNQEAGVDPVIDAIAFQLNYDRDSIIAFVVNEIAYDPYAGALRGPLGTVMAGAGNSLDKAQLLQALLSASLIDAQIAFTTIDERAGQTLLASVGAQETTPAVMAEVAATWTNTSIASPGAAATPSAEQSAVLAQIRADIVSSATADIGTTARNLTNSLTRAGVDLVQPALALPESERSRHACVLIPNGTTWTRVAVTNQPIADASPATPPEGPGIVDADYHQVTFRIITDTYSAGAVQSGQIFRRHSAVRTWSTLLSPSSILIRTNPTNSDSTLAIYSPVRNATRRPC